LTTAVGKSLNPKDDREDPNEKFLGDDEELFQEALRSFHEYPVESSDGDVAFDYRSKKVLHTNLPDLTLSASYGADGAELIPSLNRLTFKIDPSDMERMDSLEAARLQMMGTSGDSDLDTHIVIRTREGGPQIDWTFDDEDWEYHELWVSPNLKPLLLDAITHGARDSITFELIGKGEAKRTVASYDHSPCLAPTIALSFPMPEY
jgi:hypothetical protein